MPESFAARNVLSPPNSPNSLRASAWTGPPSPEGPRGLMPLPRRLWMVVPPFSMSDLRELPLPLTPWRGAQPALARSWPALRTPLARSTSGDSWFAKCFPRPAPWVEAALLRCQRSRPSDLGTGSLLLTRGSRTPLETCLCFRQIKECQDQRLTRGWGMLRCGYMSGSSPSIEIHRRPLANIVLPTVTPGQIFGKGNTRPH